MILGPASLTEILVGFLPLSEGEAHAVIVLPGQALVAADHVPLHIFLLLVFTTYASDDLLFVLPLAGARCGFGGCLRGFVLVVEFGLAFLRSVGYHVEVFVLAFG